MKRSRFICTVAILVLCSLAHVLYAATPRTISYQGYLKDGAGIPVTAPTDLTFRLYSSTRSNSGPIWSETHNVTPVNGVYGVELGSSASLDVLPFDITYFLGVTLGSDSEFVPRQVLTSTPYAFRAATVDNVSTSSLIVSTVPTGMPPLQVSSTTLVPNLNADLLDGLHATDIALTATNTCTNAVTILQGQVTALQTQMTSLDSTLHLTLNSTLAPQMTVRGDMAYTMVVWPQWDGTKYNIMAEIHASGSGVTTVPAKRISTNTGNAIAPQVISGHTGGVYVTVVWRQWDGTQFNLWKTTGDWAGTFTVPVRISP